MKAKTRRYLYDLAERAIATFAQGFVGVVTLDALVGRIDLRLSEQLATGALAGGYAIIKALAARRAGAADSASLLPAQLDPPKG